MSVELAPISNTLAPANNAGAPEYRFAFGPHAPECSVGMAAIVDASDILALEFVSYNPGMQAKILLVYEMLVNPSIRLANKIEAARLIDHKLEFYIPSLLIGHFATTGVGITLLGVGEPGSSVWQAAQSADRISTAARLLLDNNAPNDVLRAATVARIVATASSNAEREPHNANQLIQLADPVLPHKPPRIVGSVLGASHVAVQNYVGAAGFKTTGQYFDLKQNYYFEQAINQQLAGNLDPMLVERLMLVDTFDSFNFFIPRGSDASPYERHLGRAQAQTEVVDLLSDVQVAIALDALDAVKTSKGTPGQKQTKLRRILHSLCGR